MKVSAVMAVTAVGLAVIAFLGIFVHTIVHATLAVLSFLGVN